MRLNDLLLPDTRQGMFVTAVYGILDPNTGVFTYANSGHNPPLWIRRDGNIERLTRTGIALGVLDGTTRTERSIELQSGECLLLYTDGLTEAFSPTGEIFGEERLQDTIRKADCRSASHLLRAIDKALAEFVETEALADDLTMLIVRRA